MADETVLLFDAGGVLVDWRGTSGLVELTQGRFDAEQARRFWMGFEAITPFETGGDDGTRFARAALEALELDMSPTAFLAVFDDWMRGPYAGAMALVERIRPVYRRAILSNTNPVHWRRLIDDYRIDVPFEKAFASHEIGARKPDPEAFEFVCRALDVRPDQVRFFDDNPECIEAACELGMTATQVRGLDELQDALAEFDALRPPSSDNRNPR
ncbi:HAD family hydrolase [Chromohalobacter canadensis]|uniref:HAD-IA family hydrolase n=1 Tax=Chromohalobacter canadensis TaxID=141389 RepID=A0A285VDW5_9GAMM|nr:HAD-IA family hydrolase [Chromohalobacter canadensis]MCK0770159.1 HAD-IA family hydrolase [Chromohalobacter canadensis]WQH10261.1 HAD-IA family hydrolase [Chromohalobacter canadensis]SOC52315.1 putative hydrolase of the HAD superfamily [Chromohalobacter canadensis]